MVRYFALLALACVAVAACQTDQAGSLTDSVDTHAAMVQINPAALAIWDVTNNAMNDEGALDGSLMDSTAWTRIEHAAAVLQRQSVEMARAQRLHVGAHNDAVEGFATRAEIQAMIDRDPGGFRALSQELADHAAEMVAAARARDVQQTGGLAESLSEKCQTCHTRYWEKPA